MRRFGPSFRRLPVKTRLSLNRSAGGGRDIGTPDRRTDDARPMPDYLRDHHPLLTPVRRRHPGYASGSFGPTTPGGWNSYVARFQEAGGSLVMLAKGNRSKQSRGVRQYGALYWVDRCPAPGWRRTAPGR